MRTNNQVGFELVAHLVGSIGYWVGDARKNNSLLWKNADEVIADRNYCTQLQLTRARCKLGQKPVNKINLSLVIFGLDSGSWVKI